METRNSKITFAKPTKTEFTGFVEAIRKKYFLARLWLTEDQYSDTTIYVPFTQIPRRQKHLVVEGTYIRMRLVDKQVNKHKYTQIAFDFNIYPPWTAEELEESAKRANELYEWLKEKDE